jgi:hypothetical protein
VYVPHFIVSNMHQRWFKMGGTTEHADNFVPVDERLVSFFVSQIAFFLSPPQAARKAIFS